MAGQTFVDQVYQRQMSSGAAMRAYVKDNPKELAHSLSYGSQSARNDAIEVTLHADVCERGATYAVYEDITDMLFAVSLRVPLAARITPEMLPSEAGFVWCQAPWRLPPFLAERDRWWYGDMTDMARTQGFYWQRMPFGGSQGTARDGFYVSFLTEPPRFIKDEQGQTIRVRKQDMVCLSHMSFWVAFGDPISELEIGRLAGIAPREASAQHEMTQRIQFVYAFLQFIRQKLTGRIRHPVRRTVARQWRHIHENPFVETIELRKRAVVRKEPDTATQPVEWSCHWFVGWDQGGHWHKYHTRNGIEYRWVLPYVKGNLDKPLRIPARQQFAVVR